MRGGVGVLYGVLGELEVRAGDRPLALPGGHELGVLAMLLLQANRQVAKRDLIRAAWGTSEVSDAQLHKAISALRKLLDQVGRGEAIKTRPRFGYELRTGEEELDLLLFQRLLGSADQAAAAGRTADEADCLRRALDLWHGRHALSNLTAEAFRAERALLDKRRKRAAVRLFGLELERGRHEAVLSELQQFAGWYPTDAQLRRQLMVALYRSGHSAEATAAFEEHGAALERESGSRIDPGVRDLHYAILGQNEDKIAAAGAGRPEPVVVVAPVPRQLPAAPADFVGREDLVAEAIWLLGRRTMPVVVISGPGGIGKTALALRAANAAAEDFPDGQLWAEMRAMSGRPAEPGEVLAQFLRALGAPVVPDTTPERAAAYRSMLADRRVLVVLDDVADAAQIRDLLPADARCPVLITARRRLPDIAGAHHVAPLGPLAVTTATELFHRIVTAGKVDVSAEGESVEAVVRLCGGLPLAVRIAATLRVHDFHRPTSALARRLAEQGTTAFEYGEQSLARTLSAGLEPVSERAVRLFHLLGLAPVETFGEWVAAALLDEPAAGSADALSELAAASIVDPAGAPGRYRFHDLTREYAGRSATTHTRPADRVAALTRLCQSLLTLTRHAHEQIYGGGFEVVHSDVPDANVPAAALEEIDHDPLAWFERERPNIRAAVELAAALGLAGICWDLAVSTHEYYTIGGYHDDWYATHQTALAACRAAGDRRGEGVVLVCLGQPALVASSRGAAVSGVDQLQAAVELLSALGERHGLAIALRTLANARRRRGELGEPLRLFTAALEHYEESGDAVGRWQALRFVGQTHLDLGDRRDALEVLHRAESVARELGQERLVGQTRYWVGMACLATDDLATAAEAFADVLAAFPEQSDVGHAYGLHGEGELARRAGERERAARLLAEAETIAHAAADAGLQGRIVVSQAALARDRADAAAEVDALYRAIVCFAGCGAVHLEVQAYALLAGAEARRGRAAAAAAAWDRVAALYDAGPVPPEDRIHQRPA